MCTEELNHSKNQLSFRWSLLDNKEVPLKCLITDRWVVHTHVMQP